MSDLRKPTIPEMLPVLKQYYELPGNSVGGSLHIVLEDGNVKNKHVDSCIEDAHECGDMAGYYIGKLLRLMSFTQRTKIIRHHYREYAG